MSTNCKKVPMHCNALKSKIFKEKIMKLAINILFSKWDFFKNRSLWVVATLTKAMALHWSDISLFISCILNYKDANRSYISVMRPQQYYSLHTIVLKQMYWEKAVFLTYSLGKGISVVETLIIYYLGIRQKHYSQKEYLIKLSVE